MMHEPDNYRPAEWLQREQVEIELWREIERTAYFGRMMVWGLGLSAILWAGLFIGASVLLP